MLTLVIYGCGGHGRSIADVASHAGYEAILFVDPAALPGEKILDFNTATEFPSDNNYHVIIGIGDNHKRAQAFDMLNSNGIPITNVLSKQMFLSDRAKLHSGVFAGCGVHIGPNAVIHENTLLNTRCIIEHDVKIGKHCHISVNAVIAGKAQIGDFVMIGANATVIDNIHICSNVTVGAGAVVVDNITEPGVYVGVPARRRLGL